MVMMETKKLATDEMAVNEPLVKVVSIVDTLKAIPAGRSVLYTCQALGNYMTVYSAVRRMNERLGRAQWLWESNDNGATFTITNLGDGNGEPIVKDCAASQAAERTKVAV